MTLQWIPEPANLGLFDETTAEECEASKVNREACYTACVAMGASGWNALFLPFCQDICMTEACGKGIILTPHDMQKAGEVVGTCVQKCVDDAQKLPNVAARATALAACPTTCDVVNALEKAHAENTKSSSTEMPPPSKSNTVWWVLGGLAVLVGGYFLVKGAGSVGTVLDTLDNPRSVRERIQKELDDLRRRPGVTMHGRYGASYGQYNAAALDAGIEARQRYAESWRRTVLELPGAITETKIKTRSYRHTPVLSWRVFTNGETWVAVSSRVNVGIKIFTREEYEKWISRFYEVLR